MDFHPDSGLESFRQEVRQFLHKHLPPDLARGARVTRSPRADVMRWQKILNAQGWGAPYWAKEHGGTGWSVPTACWVNQLADWLHCAPGSRTPPWHCAPELVGAMEKAIEATAEYPKTRQQFGTAIGSFQALQHRIADMAAEMEVARSMLFAALASVQNDATRKTTISAAKALIGRAAKFVCAQAIQLHGGIGMTEEYLVGHYFKRAVVADLLLGSSERHEAAWAMASH
jgi:alkylation response protein AidB-like acyl-CoA dehydrogenase